MVFFYFKIIKIIFHLILNYYEQLNMYHLIDHPIIKTKLSRMRNIDTDSRDFRFNLVELSQFMVYEATKDLKLNTLKVKTPCGIATGYKLKEKVVLVPILRAGLGMVEGFSNMIPQAPVGFIGLYRDEKTLEAHQYYCKMPDCIKGANVIMIDPMLATANSMVKAINIIKQKYKPKSIRVCSILAAPEGIKALLKAHKDIELYVCAVDQKLNKNGYIVPGLGDAGDRIFGTK